MSEHLKLHKKQYDSMCTVNLSNVLFGQKL